MGNQGLLCESRGAQLGVPHPRSSISFTLPFAPLPVPGSSSTYVPGVESEKRPMAMFNPYVGGAGGRSMWGC